MFCLDFKCINVSLSLCISSKPTKFHMNSRYAYMYQLYIFLYVPKRYQNFPKYIYIYIYISIFFFFHVCVCVCMHIFMSIFRLLDCMRSKYKYFSFRYGHFLLIACFRADVIFPLSTIKHFSHPYGPTLAMPKLCVL